MESVVTFTPPELPPVDTEPYFESAACCAGVALAYAELNCDWLTVPIPGMFIPPPEEDDAAGAGVEDFPEEEEPEEDDDEPIFDAKDWREPAVAMFLIIIVGDESLSGDGSDGESDDVANDSIIHSIFHQDSVEI